jgi:teichuronic acid exporter
VHVNDLGRQVVSSLRWQATAKLASQLFSWSVTIVVMRLLSPGDYGLMAMVMVLVGLAALFADLGIGAALVQSPVVDKDQQRKVFGLALLVNLVICVTLAVGSPAAAWAFDEPRLMVPMMALALQFPIASLCVVPDAMARRQMRFKELSLIELAVQLGTSGMTLWLAWQGAGVWALVGGQVCAPLFRATLLSARFDVVRPTFTLRGQSGLVRFGGGLTLTRVVWFGYTNADVFIAGRLLGAQLLGVYSVATSLATLPMSKIMAVSNQVVFSALARLQEDPRAFAEAVRRALRVGTTISVGLLWGLAAVADDLIPALLGRKWESAVVPLQVIAAIVPLRVAAAVLSVACVAIGRVELDLKGNLAAAALLLPAFAVGASLGGAVGLAVSWAATFPIAYALFAGMVAKSLGSSKIDLLTQVWPALAAGALLVLCATVVRGSAPEASPWLRIALAGGCGTAAFMAGVRLLDRDTWRMLTEFLLPSRVAGRDGKFDPGATPGQRP